MKNQTIQQAADDRLREFTKDWSAPEKLVVEDVIAGRAIAAVASIDRRRDPGRPWKAA